MKGLEILELRPVGEYLQVRAALNGNLAIPFDVHKSIRGQFRTEAAFEDYLARQVTTLLDTYGDARRGQLEPSAEFLV